MNAALSGALPTVEAVNELRKGGAPWKHEEREHRVHRIAVHRNRCGYAVGLYVGKDRTEDTYRDAPRRRDTTTTVKERLLPEQKQGEAAGPSGAAGIASADSVFNVGWLGMDLLVVAVRSGRSRRGDHGHVRHGRDPHPPIRPAPGTWRSATFQPFPRKEIERIITDSIYVPPMVNPAPV